ncbi:MAG: radical SAM protein [bacterium]|nr:radical SAM protein [bacterium]
MSDSHLKEVSEPTGTDPLRFEEIRIENTNRCGYRCHFCPRELMTRNQGVMPIADLDLVLERVGRHRGRVDLHGFGEPLLDPNLIAKTALVRARWPEAEPTVYSTLGVEVPDAFFDRLLAAGLAELEVSFYGNSETAYREVHGAPRYSLALANLDRLARAARRRPGFRLVLRDHPTSPEETRPAADQDSLHAFLKKWEDSGLAVLERRALHNYGNGRRYKPQGAGQSCSVAWGYRKRVLQVTWNLKVIPCCFDFDATVVLGDLRTQTLQQIFDSAVYRDFVTAHLENRLEAYPVCTACERCHRP